jgi:hypothetical protein
MMNTMTTTEKSKRLEDMDTLLHTDVELIKHQAAWTIPNFSLLLNILSPYLRQL